MLMPRNTMMRRSTWSVGLAAFISVLALTTSVTTARAGSAISVTTTAPGVNSDADCSLPEAIYAANLDASKAPDPANLGDPNAFIPTGCAAGDGDDVIVLPEKTTFTMSGPVDDVANYAGPTATPMVTSAILIEGAGSKIQHGGGTVPYRAFAVGPGGDLTLHEIHVKGFEVQGGDGRLGGGGGLGAGGAIYVQGGALSVGWSTFEQNGALGGDGSNLPEAGATAGGGGGGLGGNGGASKLYGNPDLPYDGGGGGGARANGGDGFFGGGYGGGRLGSGRVPCGGAGGEEQIIGGAGEDGECRGGGGGGGTDAATAFDLAAEGGDGHYGGGGGGGGCCAGDGGSGGFGGAGGASGITLSDEGGGGDGGNGGFGGGGGAGPDEPLSIGGPGHGGTFGGDADNIHGGGGAGLGGAIFGDQATIVIRNSTFAGNYASRGHFGGGDAHDGRDSGGAIFLVAGSLFVNSSTFSNNLTTGTGGLGGGGIAVYRPTTGEATSLTVRNSILAGNGPHECYARNGASVSGVGNLITDNSENDHGDAICEGVVTSADPQLETLALNAPGRTPTMAIPGTSPAVDAADATSEPDDQRGAARPQGAGFDVGAYEAGDSAPKTTITLTPGAPNGSNGWYRTAVGVSITALDDSDPAPSTRCGLNLSNSPTIFDDLPSVACTLSSVVADSALHTIHAASRDASGNTESPLVTRSFKIDRTAPTLVPSLSASPVVGQSGVTASPNATDATSGVASSSCGAVDTSTPGVKTVACTATDNAGNTANANLTYVVEYRILGFFEPVSGSKWKVGQTVPVKFAVGDSAGTRISDAVGRAFASACQVRFSASGAQTKAPQCMRYDVENDQFAYPWKLGKSGTGAATIRVTLSYPGTTFTTQKTLQITITA
jgi:hypothetical protein